MGIPDVKVTQVDGGLRLQAASPENSIALTGVSTGGVVNQVYTFATLDDVKATLISGPLAEAVGFVIELTGGPVYAAPAAQTVAATIGTITQSGTGPAVTPSGTPRDGYQLQFQIAQPGVGGTATFKISYDGGISWSGEYVTPASGAAYLVGDTGVSIAFASVGSFVAGEVYSLATTPPGASLGDISTAVSALLLDVHDWSCVYVVGAPTSGSDSAKATASAALAAAVSSLLSSAELQSRYVAAIVEMPDVADSALPTAFASLAAYNVIPAARYIAVRSSLRPERVFKRSSAYALAYRWAQIPIGEDFGEVDRGPLTPKIVGLYGDERKLLSLDSQRFATLRTIVGRQGFYVTNANTMAVTGSDFSLAQFVRIENRAKAIAYQTLLSWLNGSVLVSPSTGFIQEKQARIIDDDVRADMRAGLGSSVTDATCIVTRTDPILSTRRLRAKLRILSRGYLKEIDLEVGYTNPAYDVRAA